MRSTQTADRILNLNVFRVVFCLILAYIISRGAVGYDKLYLTASLHDPLPLFELLGIGQVGAGQIPWVRTGLIVCLITSALGIYTRVSLTIAASLYFLYFGNQMGFIKSSFSDYVYHSKAMAFYILLIMACAPEIRKLSIDGLKLNRWSTWRSNVNPQRVFGITVIQWMLGLAYLGSALSKLMHDVQWADGYTLQSYLLRKHLLYDNALGGEVMQHLDWCQLMSWGTLLFEGTFLLCVMLPKLRLWYLLAGAIFHGMIYLLMDINFGVYFFITYLAFINYARLPSLRTVTTYFRSPKRGMPTRLQRRMAVAGQTVLGTLLVLQVLSIAFEVENWPVSNYGVFINRHVPSDIREYRFACSCEGEQIYVWIPREQLPRSQTTLSRMIRLAHSYQSQSELDNIVQEVKNYQMLLNPACEELVLMRGWGETDDSGRLTARFEPVHYEVIRDRSITMRGG